MSIFVESSQIEGGSQDNDPQWLECTEEMFGQVPHNARLSFNMKNVASDKQEMGNANVNASLLPIDVFGRLPEFVQKMGLKGGNNNTMQEYRHRNEIKSWLSKHSEKNVKSGNFIVSKEDLYELWLLLQTKQLTVYNEDDKYTVMEDEETNVKIRFVFSVLFCVRHLRSCYVNIFNLCFNYSYL